MSVFFMVDLTFIAFLQPYSKMSANTLDCYFVEFIDLLL